MDWYLKVLRNYIGFGGRARRKEYWMFVLVNFILILVLGSWIKFSAGNGLAVKVFSPPFMACWFCCHHGRYCSAGYTTPIVRPGGYCCC
jgi:uncharacterized membrane protein YhaH (DUF805 family)